MTRLWQYAISSFVLLLAVVFAVGAAQSPSDGGYAGIGSNFVPWVIAAFLFIVGALLTWQVFRGGFARFTDSVADVAADYRGALWVSAGVLLMAVLITRVGFVIAATTLFVCVARAFGSRMGWRDALIGAAIVFPVFWLFTLVLDVNLPRLFNDWL
jgi:putative tricarboxylic transport membrane protein